MSLLSSLGITKNIKNQWHVWMEAGSSDKSLAVLSLWELLESYLGYKMKPNSNSERTNFTGWAALFSENTHLNKLFNYIIASMVIMKEILGLVTHNLKYERHGQWLPHNSTPHCTASSPSVYWKGSNHG